MDKPTPSDLKQRYPAFAGVSDPTVQYWLTDAERTVTEDWGDDYAVGLMTLAAREMVKIGVPGLTKAAIPAGVTSFRSGTFSATVSEEAANAAASGGWFATEFAAMLRRKRGGPFLAGLVC